MLTVENFSIFAFYANPRISPRGGGVSARSIDARRTPWYSINEETSSIEKRSRCVSRGETKRNTKRVPLNGIRRQRRDAPQKILRPDRSARIPLDLRIPWSENEHTRVPVAIPRSLGGSLLKPTSAPLGLIPERPSIILKPAVIKLDGQFHWKTSPRSSGDGLISVPGAISRPLADPLHKRHRLPGALTNLPLETRLNFVPIPPRRAKAAPRRSLESTVLASRSR